MSNSILSSFACKSLGIWDVRSRDCKYLKNGKWQKYEVFQNLLKYKYFKSCKVWCL